MKVLRLRGQEICAYMTNYTQLEFWRASGQFVYAVLQIGSPDGIPLEDVENMKSGL